MTNIVDTSPETVNAEFDAAEKEIGTEEQAQAESSPEQEPIDEAQQQAEIAMAAGMIGTSLRFAIGTFSGVTVDEQVTNQAAESYAVLIIKYYPGGIFALLDRYKEELAAATATFVLIRAVAEARVKKQEEDEAKKQAEANKKKTFAPELNSVEGREASNGEA